MKRTILTCITVLMAFPLFAQYTGPGYYRIQNQGSAKRYLSIANNQIEERYNSKDKLMNAISTSAFGFEIPASSLRTVKKEVADPSTILYIDGNTSGGLRIKGQGIDTKSLTQGFDLLEREGFLYCKINEGGIATEAFLVEFNDNENYDSNCSVVGRSKLKDFTGYTNWKIERIDNETNYLGIAPNEEVKIGDNYYTTIYTDFAYELPTGMKAYYIDNHFYDTNHVQEPIAELKEITNGRIPAETPVIIECSSDNAANNKVKILTESLDKITDNQLEGRYFCYIEYINYHEKTNYELSNPDLKNALVFDKSKMRVLGMKDGKLAMVEDNDKALVRTRKEGNTSKYYYYIPANKAYLPIKSSESSATSIKLLLPNEYQVALSISKVVSDENVQTGIYTLTGVKVKEENDATGLPSGIYIINGKKQVVK